MIIPKEKVEYQDLTLPSPLLSRLMDLAKSEGKSLEALLLEMVTVYRREGQTRKPEVRSLDALFASSWEHSIENGTSEITMDEIDEEIDLYRTEQRTLAKSA